MTDDGVHAVLVVRAHRRQAGKVYADADAGDARKLRNPLVEAGQAGIVAETTAQEDQAVDGCALQEVIDEVARHWRATQVTEPAPRNDQGPHARCACRPQHPADDLGVVVGFHVIDQHGDAELRSVGHRFAESATPSTTVQGPCT